MRVLADWIPIIVFFVSFKLIDIYVATGLAIITTIFMMSLMKFFRKKIEKIQWFSLGLIVIFGGATIILQDEQFIKLKPSLLYIVFCFGLLLPQFFGKVLIKSLMGKHLELPQPIWIKLNTVWALFFGFLAILNLWVANNFSTDFWVEFKLFGMLGLTIAFTLVQAIWLSKYKQPENNKTEAD
jgi:intracellular septation protein